MRFWNSIYNIGILPADEERLQRKKRVNNQVNLFTAIATVFFIPYLFVIGNYYYIKFEIATALLIILSFTFNYYGWLMLSMCWRYFVILLDVSYASLEMPHAGFQYFLLPLALIPFILSGNRLLQITFHLSALAAFFACFFAAQSYTPHFTLNVLINNITYCVVLGMTFLLCGLFIFKFRQASRKYEKIIQHQLKEIEEHRQEILDSIEYAKRIQKAQLPTEKYIQKSMHALKPEREEIVV